MAKLLIVVKSIDGGTGTFILNLAEIHKYFPNKSMDVALIALQQPSFRKVDKKKFIFRRKKNFYPERYSLSLKNISYFVQDLLWLNGKIREIDPDVIIGIDIHANLLIQVINFLLGKKSKTILITQIDLDRTLSDKSTRYTKLILKMMVRFFYEKADVIICGSKSMAGNFKKTFGIKKEVSGISNGALLHPFKALKKPKTGIKILISVARLDQQKDYPTLIKAFNLAFKEYPLCELWIISDGPERKNLEKMVSGFGLSGKIKFMGWVKSIYPYLRRADIFVLSSRRDGFSYVLMEAMSQGLPAISTDTPYGPAEVLENGKYGILVPMEDEFLMKEAMLKLLKDQKKREYFSKKSLERSRVLSREVMLLEYAKFIRRSLKQ